MNGGRRAFLKSSAAAAGIVGGLAVPPSAAARALLRSPRPAARDGTNATPRRAPGDYLPVVTPDGATLPFRMVDGVKVFHLVPEPVAHEFAPGLTSDCWGYNGRVHGPTIEAVEGDRVRIYVTNKLPVSTTVHWHGVVVPNGMDGVGGLSQRAIESGETFKYEFTLKQHGTFMYHSHHDEMTQMALGLMGMFVVHPRAPAAAVDRDYVFLLSTWRIAPGTRRPDPIEMTDFNVFTFNARIFPGTTPIVAKQGERVRLRIGNLSAMDHHPIHLHGHNFEVTATDGGEIPPAGRWRETSILVPVGSTRTVEFVADNPGDWALHCHMTHHIMTQMGHGLPNIVGVDPSLFDEKLAAAVPDYLDMGEMAGSADEHFDPAAEDPSIPRNSLPMMGGAGPHGYITMGGMFTLLKVRESGPAAAAAAAHDDWYVNPAGTQADVATPGELESDGIEP